MKTTSIMELDQSPYRIVHGYYYKWFKYQEYLFKNPKIAEAQAQNAAMLKAFFGMNGGI